MNYNLDDMSTTIPCQSISLEKVRYAVRRLFPDLDYQANINVESYRDNEMFGMIVELITEVMREEKIDSIPVDFTYGSYSPDVKPDISNTSSYLTWLHHGTYIRHKITKHINLNQYILYPSLNIPGNTVYKYDYVVR